MKPTWWYNDYENISSIDNLNFENSSVLIQDLVGNIENLQGNIEDLGPATIPTPLLVFGKDDGGLDIEDQSVVTGYETLIASKTWTSEDGEEFYLQRLKFTYQVLSLGSFEIQYSKDNQVTWRTEKTVVIDAANLGKRVQVVNSKLVKARQFSWRIRSSNGIIELVDFKATTHQAGYSR